MPAAGSRCIWVAVPRGEAWDSSHDNLGPTDRGRSCNIGAWPEIQPRGRQSRDQRRAPLPGSRFAAPNVSQRSSSSCSHRCAGCCGPTRRTMSRWFASLYIVLLPTPHMEIHPEFDHLHGRLETQGSWTIDYIVHRRGMGTETVVVVF